ncbi:MAG: ATP-binding cassette domain-containing protein [Burkholderiales bacterium]|nr:ATP-binding cassette domain-containing protein [Burkholderiales bacterium]
MNARREPGPGPFRDRAAAPAPVIEAAGLKKHFPIDTGVIAALVRRGPPRTVKAIDGVDVSVSSRSIFGLVGESGSGKSTLGMTLVRLHEPTAGSIFLSGEEVTHVHGDGLRRFRRRAQIIFQDPYGSLNPRLTVGDAVEEPLKIHGIGDRAERAVRVVESLERVSLQPRHFLHRYPHELSGGQRQRAVIARTLVLEPDFVVADEPISMLDVSIRAGILDLLETLSKDLGLGVLYVSHDISTVRYICDRVAIMYLGVFVEQGETGEVIDHPAHPYTQSLMAAVPLVDPTAGRKRVELPGEVPTPIDIPSGCRFRTRCPCVMDICSRVVPAWRDVGPGHRVACHLYQDATASSSGVPARGPGDRPFAHPPEAGDCREAG